MPTVRQRLTEVEIRFDRLTDDVIEVFRYGDCARLAVAVNDLTGWPFAVVWCSSYQWNHVGTWTPDGKFFDVRGARSEDVALAEGACGGCDGSGSRIATADYQELLDIGAAWHLYTHPAPPLYAEAISYLAERLIITNGYGSHLRVPA
jgi:hypothetical protein